MPTKRPLTWYAVAFSFALVALALLYSGGCARVVYPTPLGPALATTFLKDVKIGEASYKRAPDGSVEFGVKQYDSQAKIADALLAMAEALKAAK